MNAVTFGTHEAINRLKAVGVEEAQAVEQVKIWSEIISDPMVTRGYLEERFSIFENRILRWLIPLLLGQAALIATLVKLF